jgi:hypothetical protein
MGPIQLQTISQGSYQLLSSTRFDPFLATLSWNNDHDNEPCPFFLLPYHFDRLASAAKTHEWDSTSTSILTYHYLKSTCLDAVSKEQQRLPNGSSSAFRVFSISFSFIRHCLNFQSFFLCIDSNHTFTRRSNLRDCNPFDDDFHV